MRTQNCVQPSRFKSSEHEEELSEDLLRGSEILTQPPLCLTRTLATSDSSDFICASVYMYSIYCCRSLRKALACCHVWSVSLQAPSSPITPLLYMLFHSLLFSKRLQCLFSFCLSLSLYHFHPILAGLEGMFL